jgi:type IV secretory pathway VirB10-like protein
MPDTHPNPNVPQVTDWRSKIEGLLPQNTQARVLGAIALVMVIIIGFSGRNAPKERPRPAPTVSPVNADKERIQAYRAQIEEQVAKLAAEESRLAQTKQVLTANAATGSPAPKTPPPTAFDYSNRTEGFAERPDEWERDRRRREHQSLFASNVALSYRRTSPPTMEVSGKPAAVSSTVPDTAADAQRNKTETETAQSTVKKHRIFEGTVFETVLTNRLDASLSGPVNCMVTTNLYSHDHQHLLIPQGTRLLGEVRKIENLGEKRVAVFFHRLIMPDGYSVSLDKFQGLNQVGETGLRDQVNHHYLQIFGASLAIGALAGLSQANTRYSTDESGFDAYRQGVASSLSQSSLHILDRYLNVLPTFTIREGHRIKVYLSADLLLPAYDQHEVTGDL